MRTDTPLRVLILEGCHTEIRVVLLGQWCRVDSKEVERRSLIATEGGTLVLSQRCHLLGCVQLGSRSAPCEFQVVLAAENDVEKTVSMPARKTKSPGDKGSSPRHSSCGCLGARGKVGSN